MLSALYPRSKAVFKLAKKVFDLNGNDPGHSSPHALRVLKLAKRIAEDEDMELLEAAAILHDIYRPRNGEGGADAMDNNLKIAGRILDEVGYLPEERAQILQAISTHSRSSLTDGEKTPLGIALYDADKLDGGGMNGIERAKSYGKSRGWDQTQTARWYLGRIFDVIKNEPFYKEKSMEIAKALAAESLSWCEQILNGEFHDTLDKMGYADISDIIAREFDSKTTDKRP